MNNAEVTAYLAGREVASGDEWTVDVPATAAQIDALTERPDLHSAFDRLGPDRFRSWVFRGCWDRLGEKE